jgi:hypothetical protein
MVLSNRKTGEASGKHNAAAIAESLGLADSIRSFVKLCDLGCDAEFLAECFYMVSHNQEIEIVPKVEKRKPYKFGLRSLDDYKSALGGLTKTQIEALRKKLNDAADAIDKLNKSSLTYYLSPDEMLPYRHLSNLPALLRDYSNKFIPFYLERAEKVGERQRPYFRMYMNFLCDDVTEKTGRANYRLICDVLNELGIDLDTQALKQWRSNNKPFWQR